MWLGWGAEAGHMGLLDSFLNTTVSPVLMVAVLGLKPLLP